MPASPFSTREGSLKPGPVPSTGNAQLEQYLAATLEQLWQQIQRGDIGLALFQIQSAAPAKLTEGMAGFFAAGVVGAGAGLYEYRGGAWVKL